MKQVKVRGLASPTRRIFRNMLLASFSAFVLIGCATLPAKRDIAPPKPIEGYAAALSFAAPEAAWPSDRWWLPYGDAQLSTLIDEALAGAPDMRAAAARLDRANAVASAQGAALLPTLDASASVQEAKQSYNNGIPAEFVPKGWNDTGNVGLNFNWTIDFWGKNRAALTAATSEAKASQADAAAARLMLSASIALAYADLAAHFADRDAAAGALAVRTDTVKLIRERVANGLENEGATQRAYSARASAEAQLAQTDETIALTQNRLAALLGEGPDRGRAIARPARPVLIAFGLPANVPVELVGRRPDVIAARLRAEAAASKIKEAKAGFYPNINLAAAIGVQSLGLGMLTKSGSTFGDVGPAISLPIFDGGRLRANYRGAEAEYDLAIASYDSAVTQALHDVADAATSGRALAFQLDTTRRAETSATAAWQIATNRYRGGLATYLEVLTAEDALITARRNVVMLETRGFSLDVGLVRALGGGFRS